jgi:RNA polymerase sigma-70 factor (ECF subfamily)
MVSVRRKLNGPIDEAATAMQRYSVGEDSAFDELYERVARRLYGYLLRQTGDVPLAEDLLQQTLLHVHRARGSFVAGADVMAWVLTIARRLLIDSSRSASCRAAYIREVAALDPPVATARADELVQAQQLVAQLENELARLPKAQRVAFELLRHRDLSLSQAAEELQITVGALKVRLHRARGALRAALATHG